MPDPTSEELVHRLHVIELERLVNGRDRDQRLAADSLLTAVWATGAQLVARHEGTVTVRLPGTAGPDAPPVVRLAEPAGHEPEQLVLAAIKRSKELAEQTATGAIYTVIPAEFTGMRPPGIDDETARAQVVEAFSDIWEKTLPARHPAAPPATAVMDPGVDPRILQRAVDGLAKSKKPPARLILTDARRPTPSPNRRDRALLPEERPVRPGETYPTFPASPPAGGGPNIVVVLSSIREGELRDALPAYEYESTWPQGAPIVLPAGLTVLGVSSQGDALADALGRPQPPTPGGGRVVQASQRPRPDSRRPGGGPSGPTAT